MSKLCPANQTLISIFFCIIASSTLPNSHLYSYKHLKNCWARRKHYWHRRKHTCMYIQHPWYTGVILRVYVMNPLGSARVIFIRRGGCCYINALPLGEDEGLGYGRVKYTHSTTVDIASILLRRNENVFQSTLTNHPCYGEGKPWLLKIIFILVETT